MRRLRLPIQGGPPVEALERPPLLDVPNPFILNCGRLLLLEPMDASIPEVSEQLRLGTYPKPFILEDERVRYLHFGLAYVQSAMRIDAPDALDLRYTRKMMAFLLFQARPAHLMLVGLGGGSLAKYCYRHLPTTRISVVEIDRDVIALRGHFLVPADDARFRVICADGAAQLATCNEPVDALLVDAFDGHGLATSVLDRSFLQLAHRRLSVDGVLVMNLAGEEARYLGLIAAARTVFDRQTLLIRLRDDGNTILFAFRNRQLPPDWARLRALAVTLRTNYHLNFPGMVQLLEHAACSASGNDQDKLDSPPCALSIESDPLSCSFS